MAIPEGVETVTITTGEPITLPDGTLVRGHIRFIAPDLNLIDDEDYIFGGESTAELCHGELSITLVAPDATGITPTGWTYTAIAEFENAPGWTRYIDITKADPDVFLDDVIVLTPGDVTYPDTTFVRKVGDTMLGPLILDADPVADLGAATKQYVDNVVPDTSDFVQRTGDTMLGELVLSGDPTAALGAAPKQYVDQAEADAVTAATAAAAAESVSLSGDTMTGPLTLSGAPATDLQAATKKYVDDSVPDTSDFLQKSGGAMTGDLVLAADPDQPLQAATKQYVDSGDQTLADNIFDALSQIQDLSDNVVKLTGDQSIDGVKTFTSSPVVPAPTTDLQAATKKYVDDGDASVTAHVDALDAANVKLTGNQTVAGVKTFGSIPVLPVADPTLSEHATRKAYVDAGDATNAADIATLDGEVVKLTGDQTVNGIKTFGSIPVGPASDPTTANQLTRKQYVDDLDAENVKLTGDQTIDGQKTFVDIPSGPATNPVSANQLARKQYVDDREAFIQGEIDTLDGEVVKVTGAQTVAGVKTFTSIPVGPATDPTTANQLTRKQYVDDLDAQNVKLTGNQSIAGVKTFTSTPVGPSADPTTDDELARKFYVDSGDSTNASDIADVAADLATLDGEVVKLSGDQTVNGIKTFGSIPVLPASDPVSDNQAARKFYVDTLDAQNVKLTGAQTVNGVKTFGSIPVGPASDPTTANQLTRKSYVDTLDAQNVKLTGAQTVAGVKTFSSIPVGPSSDPTTDDQLARKLYVDETIASELFAKVGLSTGVILGGELNINAGDATKVDIGDTYGVIVDYVTTPTAPTITKITYPATTVTISDLVEPITWLLVDDTGTLIQQTLRPTNSQRRTHLILGGVLIAGGVISQEQSLPNYPPQDTNQLYDLMDAIGPFNVAGNILQSAGANLQISKTAGSVFNRGFNHYFGSSLTTDPHISDTAVQNPVSMRYVTQTPAAPVAPVTSVIPASYDNAGVVTTMPGGNNTATIQRVYITPLNDVTLQVVVQYGQNIYTSIDNAVAAIGTESFVMNPNLQDATLLGYIVVRKGATDLSNSTHGRIIQAARFSGNTAGSSSSLALAVLKAGDTMTGPLILSGDPSNVLGAATKQYVDGLDTANVKLTGAQTVAGVKTFSSIPVGPTSDPTTGNQLTRKTYVDNLDAANVKLTGDQSVAGIKTFSSIPILPASDPTTSNQATRKLYVDTLDGANVKLTGDQSVAGIKTFSSIPVLPASDPTTANQATRKSYVDTLDGANVKLTGAQSIAGVKTFSSQPIFSAGINVSAGLGSDRYARKTTTTSRASTTTLAADPHLVVAVEANATYNVLANLVWRPSGSGGFALGWTGPSGAEMIFIDNDSGSALAISDSLTFNVTTGSSVGGILVTAGTSGNLTLRWAQRISDATATVLQEHSSLWLRRVA